MARAAVSYSSRRGRGRDRARDQSGAQPGEGLAVLDRGTRRPRPGPVVRDEERLDRMRVRRRRAVAAVPDRAPRRWADRGHGTLPGFVAGNAYGWSIADDPDSPGQLRHEGRLSQGMRHSPRQHQGRSAGSSRIPTDPHLHQVSRHLQAANEEARRYHVAIGHIGVQVQW